MKIVSKNKCRLELIADGDFIISKNTMFDATDFKKGHITITGFSGCVGHSESTIPFLAEFMGYSKFQVKCFKLLSKLFNKKFEDSGKYFVDFSAEEN